MSVTHLAAGTRFPGYFEAVVENGGDLDAVNGQGEAPLHILIRARIDIDLKIRRLELLISKGAKLDEFNGLESTPTMLAVQFFGQYAIALKLLEAGASATACRPESNRRLVHAVVREQSTKRASEPKKKATLAKIIQVLEENGESLDEARDDLDRWAKWTQYSAEKRKELMKNEVEARTARLKSQKLEPKSDLK